MRGEDQRNKRNASDSNDDAPVRAVRRFQKGLFYSERHQHGQKTERGDIHLCRIHRALLAGGLFILGRMYKV